MAAKEKAAEKVEEKSRKPDWSVRCRQEPGSEYYMQAGVGWNVDVNGKKGISVKLTALPVNGDGSFLLLPPLE